MTKREAAIISAYTGIMVGSFSDMHEYVEEIMGRGVFTHEFANKAVIEEIKQAAKPDLISLSEAIV